MIWDSAVNLACRWLCRTFPSRARVVPRADAPDTPLLTQFMLWSGRVYLQHFEGPESTDWFHRHRWARMRSFVLSGWFTEERWSAPAGPGSFRRFVVHTRGRTYTMDRTTIHRVERWSPECWTLFLMSRERSDDWGYYHRGSGRFVPWRDFIRQRVPSLETGELTD